MDLFKETLPSLNLKTEHLLDDNPYAEHAYVQQAFLINRAFSFSLDTLALANDMNRLHHLDPKLQYDYYFYAVTSRKRWDKWVKPDNLNNLEVVKEYYQCSSKKAKEYLSILSPNQIKQIQEQIYRGKESKT